MATGGVSERFPIHWHVWHNEYQELDRLLQTKQNLEVVDPRGRTPLHLAVVLGHLESARVLLRHEANANAENSSYWPVVHEAVATGDPEMVQLVLQYRDYQRLTTRTEGVPALLEKLKQAPDFYVEMKWEFTSWVPLVSRVCPSDTYKVWKCGSSVRIDTTLLGFDNMSWQRGSRSFVFTGEENAATTMEIDHDSHRVYTETVRIQPAPPDIAFLCPSEDQVAARLTAPVATTYIDTEKISFERSKSGIWGWRSDKTENVNHHECKVFCASNVELITKTRTEHMTDQDKKQMKKSGNGRNPIESFLGMAEKEEVKAHGSASNGDICNISYNPCSITPEDYFDPEVNLEGKDIGRPLEQTSKAQKFKAQLWLAEHYPLSLPEQVVPIIDLMAVSNAHFRKLKDFITLQLPSGFPVKIEIPLFHVLNARITFGNIFALDSPVEGVTCIGDGFPGPVTDLSSPGGDCQAPGGFPSSPTTPGEGAVTTPGAITPGAEAAKPICVVDERVFEPPQDYSVIGSQGDHPGPTRLRDEDDEILQFAIQQSLVQPGTEDEQVTFWEALNKGQKKGQAHQMSQASAKYLRSEEERQLQRALEESMRDMQGVPPAVTSQPDIHEIGQQEEIPFIPPEAQTTGNSYISSDMSLALELSRQESQENENRRKQEEEELQAILQLSLTEK